MAHSKFPKLYNLNLFSSSAPALSIVSESEEELDSSPYYKAAAKMELQRKKRTRLQRLSTFLPKITTESKSTEDPQFLRKPAPADRNIPQARHAQHPSSEFPSRRPPSPPTTPRSSSANPPTSNRIRKHESPTHYQNAPRPSSSGGYSASREYPGRPTSGSYIPPSINTYEMPGQGMSAPMHNRNSPSQSDGESPGEKTSMRKSWLGGRKSRNASQDLSSVHGSLAWIDSGMGKVDYSLNFLVNGDKVRGIPLFY
jgi:hypothetical protein